jgi:hypothetical protein
VRRGVARSNELQTTFNRVTGKKADIHKNQKSQHFIQNSNEGF